MSGQTAELSPEKQKNNAGESDEKLICFVCTGNTCRSPMAAAVFNHICRSRGVYAESAGLSGGGALISKNAAEALNDRGVFSAPGNDYENHISRKIDRAEMEKADIVVGISSSHAMMLIGAFPDMAGKIVCMPHDISDPFGGDLETYKECLSEIESGIRELFSGKYEFVPEDSGETDHDYD